PIGKRDDEGRLRTQGGLAHHRRDVLRHPRGRSRRAATPYGAQRIETTMESAGWFARASHGWTGGPKKLSHFRGVAATAVDVSWPPIPCQRAARRCPFTSWRTETHAL